MLNVVVALLYAITGTFALNFLEVVNRGVVINMLPNGAFKIGLVTFPINTLCRSDLLNPLCLTQRFMCHLCASDCIAVHNRYGGKCGYAKGKGTVCLCGDVPPPGGIVPTAVAQCGPLTLADFGFLGLNCFINGAFDTVLIAREKILQCAIGSNGCNVDCYNNHQYVSGKCFDNDPVILNPQDGIKAKQEFCECSYD